MSAHSDQSGGTERARLALRMSGHGFSPEWAIRLARHYLDVDLLPGSVPLSADDLARYNAILDRCVESRAERMKAWPKGGAS